MYKNEKIVSVTQYRSMKNLKSWMNFKVLRKEHYSLHF